MGVSGTLQNTTEDVYENLLNSSTDTPRISVRFSKAMLSTAMATGPLSSDPSQVRLLMCRIAASSSHRADSSSPRQPTVRRADSNCAKWWRSEPELLTEETLNQSVNQSSLHCRPARQTINKASYLFACEAASFSAVAGAAASPCGLSMRKEVASVPFRKDCSAQGCSAAPVWEMRWLARSTRR